jgi:hypothetical protein
MLTGIRLESRKEMVIRAPKRRGKDNIKMN